MRLRCRALCIGGTSGDNLKKERIGVTSATQTSPGTQSSGQGCPLGKASGRLAVAADWVAEAAHMPLNARPGQ